MKVLDETEPSVLTLPAWKTPAPGRTTQDPWCAIPGSAPENHVSETIPTARCAPCGTIYRCVYVILVPAILDPFLDIAAQVIEAEAIGLLAPNWLSAFDK